MKVSILLFELILLFSCSHSSVKPDPEKAKHLYEEGMTILGDRISAQSEDRLKAMGLNKTAIEKFSAAYMADTTFIDAAFSASECTFFERDYQNSLIWLQRLLRLDTSARSTAEANQRIGYCYVNLGELENSKPYFSKAIKLWGEIQPANVSLVQENLVVFSTSIFEGQDEKQLSAFRGKGLSPCSYSIEILFYAQSINSTQKFNELITERKHQCR